MKLLLCICILILPASPTKQRQRLRWDISRHLVRETIDTFFAPSDYVRSSIWRCWGSSIRS